MNDNGENGSIELLYSVEGGTSLEQGSGKLIKSQLTSIMNQIQKSDITKLKISLDMNSTKSEMSKIGEQIKKSLKDATNIKTPKIASLQTDLEDLKLKFGSSFKNSTVAFNGEISAWILKLQQAKNALNNLDKNSSAETVGVAFKNAEKQIASANQQLAAFKKIYDSFNSQNLVFEKLQSEFGSVTSRSNGLISDDKLSQTESNLEELRTLLGGLQSGSTTNGIVADFDRIKVLTTEVQKAIQAYNSVISNTTRAEHSRAQETRKMSQEQINFNNLLRQAQNYYDKYETKIKQNKGLNNNWEGLLADLEKATAKPSNFQIGNERSRLTQLINLTHSVGVETESTTDKLKKLFGQHWDTAVVMFAINYLRQSLRQMYQNVVDVDAAMTELKKVTEETGGTYNKFLDDASTRAKILGATLSDVVQATADYARLGYNLQEASELADTSIIYKNVADGITDITASSESIISTMKAFNIEAKNSMSIADAYNEVGNKFAISSSGIGEAMQRSAAALSVAGNTMQESIALAVGANTTAQDPEKVGTTLKTLSMYLRAAKTEAEDAGESTEGMANSVSELRNQILQITDNKVDIMIDDETFKSTYQQVKELAGVFNELSDVDAANLLELMGGKRNASIVAGLLSNFQDAENALQVANNSSGSALKENEKYLDSINGKMQQFTAQFQAFSVDTIDSGTVKTFLDLASGAMSFADQLAKVDALIPGIIAGILSLKSHVGKLKSQNMPVYAPLRLCA